MLSSLWWNEENSTTILSMFLRQVKVFMNGLAYRLAIHLIWCTKPEAREGSISYAGHTSVLWMRLIKFRSLSAEDRNRSASDQSLAKAIERKLRQHCAHARSQSIDSIDYRLSSLHQSATLHWEHCWQFFIRRHLHTGPLYMQTLPLRS